MNLKNASIKTKILYSSLIVTILPLLLLELFFFINVQRSTRRQLVESAGIRADQLRTGYENELNQMEHMAALLADFSPLSVYLESDFPSRDAELCYYLENIHPMLNGCNMAYEGIKVRIYHNRDILNYSFELNNGLEGFLDTQRIADIFDQRPEFWKHIDIHYNTYQPAYSYFRIVRERSWPYGVSYVVSVHMDESVLSSPISYEPPEKGLIYVLDEAGNVLASNAADAVMEEAGLPSPPDASFLSAVEDGVYTGIGTAKFLPICRQAGNLRIVYLLPWGGMYREVFRSMLLLLLAGLFLLALCGFLSLQTSSYMLRGIGKLMDKMRHIDRNRIHKMAVANADHSSRDEIVQLDAVFTEMIMEIDHLVDTIQEQERHLKDAVIARQQAEISVLQHQINPHYLFNTLEAIRMNLIIRDDRENAEIVKLFADSFRHYIDMRHEFTTLMEEIDFIQKYIRIQNYRLDGRIVFTCEMEDTLQGCPIMKLLLQPLAENAVCHGIEEKPGIGHIRIQVIRDGGKLEMAVADDGVGMPEERLRELKSRVFGSRQDIAVGLRNVYCRIKFAYGEAADMSISSSPGKGTSVILTIPFPE